VANLVAKQPVAFAHTKLDDWMKVITDAVGPMDRSLLAPPPGYTTGTSANA
jgi:hypothetical protein